jgi:hypothetical protein
MSTSRTGGNAYAGKGTMLNSVAKKTAKTFAQDAGISNNAG